MKTKQEYPVYEQESISVEEPTFEKLLNVEELADWLKVEQSTIYAWTSKKVIPHIKLGKKALRFRVSEILDWLSEKSVCPESGPTNHVKRKHRRSVKSSASNDYVNKIIEEAMRDVSRN